MASQCPSMPSGVHMALSVFLVTWLWIFSGVNSDDPADDLVVGAEEEVEQDVLVDVEVELDSDHASQSQAPQAPPTEPTPGGSQQAPEPRPTKCYQCRSACAQRRVDLALVIDGSGSVCRGTPISVCIEWQFVLGFLSAFVSYLDVGPGHDRVAFVQFANEGTKHFGLADHQDIRSLKHAISRVQIKAENTNTSGGLYVARTQVFGVPGEDRPEVANVVLVLTDGKSTRDSARTIPEARRLADAGTRVYVVGITSAADRPEVRAMAGVPHAENMSYWFLPNFSYVDSFRVLEQVFDTFCQPAEYFTTTTTTPHTASDCPGTRTPQGCYVTREAPRDHAAAELDCQRLGQEMGRPGLGHLASVPDTTHNDLLLTALRHLVSSKVTFSEQDALDKVWLGGYEQTDITPQWRWVTDGQLVEQQGCFRDTTPSAHLLSNVSDHQTPDLCTRFCQRRNFTVAALQGGTTCSCGTTWGTTPATGGCTQFCTGNYGLYCGGINLSSIYLIDGAFVKWAFNQPNNFRKYQSCGMLQKDAVSGKWAMVDKECSELLQYLCLVPEVFCAGGTRNFYWAAGMCVYINNGRRVTWFNARLSCRMMYQGELLVVKSSATLTALSDMLTKTANAHAPYWIGLVGRTWMWTDGEEFLYTSFLNNEPNDYDKNCLIMYKNPQHIYGWTEERCHLTLPSICYIDLSSPLPTAMINQTELTSTVTSTFISALTYTTATSLDFSSITIGESTSNVDMTTSAMTASNTTTGATPKSGATLLKTEGISVFWIVVISLCLFLLVIVVIIICYYFFRKKNADKTAISPAEAVKYVYYNPTYGQLAGIINNGISSSTAALTTKQTKRVRIKEPLKEHEELELENNRRLELKRADDDVTKGTVSKSKRSDRSKKRRSFKPEEKEKAKRAITDEAITKELVVFVASEGKAEMDQPDEAKESEDLERRERRERRKKRKAERREQKKQNEIENRKEEEREEASLGLNTSSRPIPTMHANNDTTEFKGESYTIDMSRNYFSL